MDERLRKVRKTGGILRGCWAVLLLSLYLLSWGGAAFEVLTCRCVHLAAPMHRCCSGCDSGCDCTFHFALLEAPCCGVDHSQTQELYTSTDTDWDRHGKLSLSDGAAALPGLAPAVPEPLSVGVRTGLCGALPPLACGVPLCGLRAPPVCA